MKTEGRLRKKEMPNTMKGNDENQDFISKLPDDLLAIILSKLQVDEAVRCNILSKRWLGLWKQTPHMEFNARSMIKPLTQLLNSRDPLTNPELILNPFMQKGIFRYGINVFLLMHRHSGEISSCRFVHFRKSLEFGEVNTWINYLVKKKKGLKDLSLECVPNYGETKDDGSSEDEIRNPHFLHRVFYCLSSLELINYTIDCSSAFEDCHNLKVLKLKRITLDDATLNGILENCVVLENFSLFESTGFERLIIMKPKLKVLCLQALYVEDHIIVDAKNLGVLFLDSIICRLRNVSIVAPNLQNFQYHWYSTISRSLQADKFNGILAYYNELSESPICNVFQNLSTMTLDLDLNQIEESICLSIALRFSTNLQVLEINLPVFDDKNFSSYSSGYFGLPYPMAMFWEKQSNAIIQKTKFVYIKGFRGKEQEVQFAKYLITRGFMMKKITIICNDSREEAENLLSLARASPDLSIQLNFTECINTSS